MSLVPRKDVFTYEYTQQLVEIVRDRTTRKKKEFYSNLNEMDINDEEYEHAKEVSSMETQTVKHSAIIQIDIGKLMYSLVYLKT